MNRGPPSPVVFLAACLTWAFASSARSAYTPSASAVSNAARTGSVTVDVDQSVVVAAPGAGATVFVTNPEIADAQTPDAKRVLILGRKPGETTVFIFTLKGAVTRYAVTVSRPRAAVAEALRAQVPGATIDVFRGPAGMTVSGRVSTSAQAAALKAAAQQYLTDKEVLNFAVTIDASTQVSLQVRVAQVSRTVTNTLGFNWNALFNNGSVAVGVLTGAAPTGVLGQFTPGATSFGSLGGGYSSSKLNLSAVIDALRVNGLVTVLAEPNLTATSGATASFLAGGEFPVPISQGLNQVTIEWKKFGVGIDFTPTVLDANRISIRVRPEVSELSETGAVTINGFKVPSLAVRRADTTVELASGQSLAIAGMFQNNLSKTIRDFPGLGDLPIIGAMFRSSSYQRDESELVIIVTAYIVRPVDHPGDLHAPTDAINYSRDLEQLLLGPPSGSETLSDVKPLRPRLAGPAGFMLEEPH